MHRRLILGLMGLSPLALIASKVPMSNPIIDILIKRWVKSKDYTLSVLDTMPAEHLEFRPSEAQMSFAQHFLHLGFINVTYIGILLDSKTYKDVFALLEANFVMQPPDDISVFYPDNLQERDSNTNKALVSQYVSKTFDYVIDNLKKLDDAILTQGENKEKPSYLSGHTNLDLILRGESHTAHHRAQAIAYLRMKNVQPPGYSVNNAF